MKIKDLYISLVNLIFPKYCIVCENVLSLNEKFICPECAANMPMSNQCGEKDNFIENRLRLKIKIENAASLMTYNKKDDNHKIIHTLKYGKQYDIGVFMGEIAGAKINDSGRFLGIDAIIAVPLHKKRLRKRGYNQSDAIAEGISRTTGIPIIRNCMVRKTNNSTQTSKSTDERWKNSENIFQLIDYNAVNNKHILIVDDVITSGATIINCAKEILKAENTKVSVYSLSTVL